MITFDLEGKPLLNENVDYELVPSEGENWDIRILSGAFTETILKFTKLKVSDDEEYMTFNFDVVSSPDDELSDSNTDLQDHASMILDSILENYARSLEMKNQSKAKG